MAGPALKVEVVGMPETLRKIRATLAIVSADIAALLQQVATDGQGRAVTVAPVGPTGALRNGIVTSKSKAGLTHRIYIKGPAKAYAHFVEYGTKRGHIRARGFMRAAKALIRSQLPAGTRIVARKLPGQVARS